MHDDWTLVRVLAWDETWNVTFNIFMAIVGKENLVLGAGVDGWALGSGASFLGNLGHQSARVREGLTIRGRIRLQSGLACRNYSNRSIIRRRGV